MDSQTTHGGGIRMDNFQPVVFGLDDEFYGIDIAYVNAIEREQQIVRVPNSSNVIKGIINLRGEVIPVIDLRKKFGITREAKETELIIINLENNKIAIEVDRVEEIHDIDAANITEMPLIAKGIDTQYFEKVAKSNKNLIIIIDPRYLLSEEDNKSVEQILKDTAQ